MPTRDQVVQFLRRYFPGAYFTLPLGIGIYTSLVSPISPCPRSGRIKSLAHNISKTVRPLCKRAKCRPPVALPDACSPDLNNLEKWAGLRTIGAAIHENESGGKSTTEVCFYIVSIAMEGQRFA